MKLAGQKHLNRLEDSCKRLSVNLIAQGCLGTMMDFFSIMFSVKIFEQAVGPNLLQTFSPQL